eukprot:7183325-Prymnesium_polylepis.1
MVTGWTGGLGEAAGVRGAFRSCLKNEFAEVDPSDSERSAEGRDAGGAVSGGCFDSEIRVTPSFALGPILPKNIKSLKSTQNCYQTHSREP